MKSETKKTIVIALIVIAAVAGYIVWRRKTKSASGNGGSVTTASYSGPASQNALAQAAAAVSEISGTGSTVTGRNSGITVDAFEAQREESSRGSEIPDSAVNTGKTPRSANIRSGATNSLKQRR